MEKYSRVMFNTTHRQKIKRLQANGKLERLIATIKRLWKELGSLEKTVKHYNFKRPHRSSTNGKLRRSYQAFLDKVRKNNLKLR